MLNHFRCQMNVLDKTLYRRVHGMGIRLFIMDKKTVEQTLEQADKKNI